MAGILKNFWEAFPAALIVDMLRNILTSKEVTERIVNTLASPPRALLMSVIARLQEHAMIPNNMARIAQENFEYYHKLALDGMLEGWNGTEDMLIRLMCQLLYLDKRNQDGVFLDEDHNNAKFALFDLLRRDEKGFVQGLKKLQDEGPIGYIKYAAGPVVKFFGKLLAQAKALIAQAQGGVENDPAVDAAMNAFVEDARSGFHAKLAALRKPKTDDNEE